MYICMYVCVSFRKYSTFNTNAVVNDTILQDLTYVRLYNISLIYFKKML